MAYPSLTCPPFALCWPASRSDPTRQVTARPSSINELPEYGSDPRTPDKLVDGEGWRGQVGADSAGQYVW